MWFFDLTAKYGSGGWAWWDNVQWHKISDRIPVGFGPDHQRQLGIQPAGPVRPGTTTVVQVPPSAVSGTGGILGQGEGGPGAASPGTGGTGAGGAGGATITPGVATGTVPTVGGRVFGPWYDQTTYAPTILSPPDPAYAEAVRRGQPNDYVRIREELANRFPSGGPLRPGDPWYRVIRVGNRDVEVYDLGGKQGSNAGFVWWKPGQGWVDLAVEQPPGFRPELADAYRRQQAQRGWTPAAGTQVATGTGTGNPGAGTGTGATGTGTGTGGPLGTGTGPGPGTQIGSLLPTGFAESHGGIRSSIDPFTGRQTNYPIPEQGASQGVAVSQASGGGGVVLGDGTRVVFDGQDTYEGGRGVRWERAVYDPRTQRWTYFGVSGRTVDGRDWRADEAWYESTPGGLVARFRTGGKDGVAYAPAKA